MNDRSYFKVNGEVFSVVLENNRALYGDLVAIELYEESKWLKNIFELTEEEDETQVEVEANVNLNILKRLKQAKKTPFGRVVGVIKRSPRNYCGTLIDNCLERVANSIEIYEFAPADPKYPNFYLKTKDVKV